MQHMNIATEAAEQALVLLARHVPTNIGIGRPHVAIPDDEHNAVRILTDTGLWWVYEHEVDRLVEIGDFAELTTFRAGREVCRKVAHLG